MATFTEHLGLHQWVAEDNFLRTDFNADLLAIDQAVHQAQTSLDGRIDTVNANLDSKIDSVNSTLDGKINTVNSTLNSKIDSTKTSLTNTINTEKQALNTTITNTKNTLQAAIDKKCEIVTGTYTGDGQASRTISLGRAPDAVLLFDQCGRVDTDFSVYGGLALRGYPCYKSSSPGVLVLSLTDTGFTVYYRKVTSSHFVTTNENNLVFHYLALFFKA